MGYVFNNNYSLVDIEQYKKTLIQKNVKTEASKSVKYYPLQKASIIKNEVNSANPFGIQDYISLEAGTYLLNIEKLILKKCSSVGSDDTVILHINNNAYPNGGTYNFYGGCNLSLPAITYIDWDKRVIDSIKVDNAFVIFKCNIPMNVYIELVGSNSFELDYIASLWKL